MPTTMDAETLVVLNNVDGIFNETGRGTQAGQDNRNSRQAIGGQQAERAV